MTATISRIRACLVMQPLDMHFVKFQTCKKDDFCLIFRATVHKHFPYSNKTTTHAPSRLVTCAECRHTATSFVKKKTTRVRCLIWQPPQTQPRQYVRRLLSASFCSASVHSPHVWRPYYLMSEVSTEQYAVVVLLSMSNGVLYQVRTLHPIGNICLLYTSDAADE